LFSPLLSATIQSINDMQESMNHYDKKVHT